MEWRFWRRKKKASAPRLRSRRVDASSRIDVTSLAPNAADLLAHATATQLLLSEESGRVMREAWSVLDRDELARATNVVLDRYEALRSLLAEYGDDPVDALVGPTEYQREQFRRMSADNWYERVTTCFVVGGFLGDFFTTLAGGLPEPAKSDIQRVFESDEDEALFEGVIRRVIEHDDAYLSRVSLWARRLVGDTMLIAKKALRPPRDSAGENSYEPLFTDIVTEHTRRLDRLGLTA